MSKLIKSILIMFFLTLGVNQSFAEQKITFYHYDLLGSPVATTDENGDVTWRESYEPWGKKILNEDESNDNVRGYTGHVNDKETGLTYMQARYYDPEIGRFMGVDPVGFQEDNPIMFNRYAYANNNPYSFIDPNGEAPQKPIPSLNVVGLGAGNFAGFSAGGSSRGIGLNSRPTVNIPQGFKMKPIAEGVKKSQIALKSKSLNLGSGKNPMKGAVNVDARAVKGVDVQANANNLPFKSNTFTEVHAINPYGFNPVSAETARVMTSGAILRVTGSKNNKFAQANREAAKAAGLKYKGTTSIHSGHKFGTQSHTSGKELNAKGSETSTYGKE